MSSGEELRAALDEANLPALLSAMAHLTGDDAWLEDPYRPQRPRGTGDNDSGGFDPDLQRSIRDDALRLVTALREGELVPAAPPSPEKVARMLEIALAVRLPEGYGPLLHEELGLTDRYARIDSSPPAEDFRVIVIGAGFAGLMAAIKLQKAGIAYTMIEKNASVGGTWHENTYPGAGADTPTHLYWPSFAQRGDWSRYFAKQNELNAHLEELADDPELRANTRFETEVISATWSDDRQEWSLELRDADGGSQTATANAVISGVGFLNRPAYPVIAGLDSFEGPCMHTARWRDDVELGDKRVAVIGTGASAMQLVPNIAGIPDRLMVFQRSPQWAMPHPNYMREVSPATRLLMKEVPYYLGWYRLQQLWNFGDRLHVNIRWDPDWPHPERSINKVNDRMREFLTAYIADELGDRADELMPKCLPTYPPYGKRPLLDNGWFRTMARADVDLITDDVAEVRPRSIVTANGDEYPVDVLVLATGFQALRVLAPMEVRGRSGRALHDVWGEDDARAYLGITIPDFPNFFCLTGPNTFAGHGGSGVLSAELELRYTMDMLKQMLDGGLSSVECKQSVHDAYNEELDLALSQTIWAHPGMSTYYRNSAGRIVVPMPWTNRDYWEMTSNVDLADYELIDGRPESQLTTSRNEA